MPSSDGDRGRPVPRAMAGGRSHRARRMAGTTAVRVGGNAFFGPVMSPAPKGEAAGRLWDAFVVLTGTDGLFEIKRTRDRKPIFD